MNGIHLQSCCGVSSTGVDIAGVELTHEAYIFLYLVSTGQILFDERPVLIPRVNLHNSLPQTRGKLASLKHRL